MKIKEIIIDNEEMMEIIPKKANQLGKHFIFGGCEGHIRETADITFEDIGGWLVDKDDIPEDVPSEQDERKCFAEWEEINGKIDIVFRWYNIDGCYKEVR